MASQDITLAELLPELDQKYASEIELPWDQVAGLHRVGLRDPLQSQDHIRLLLLYPPGWPDHSDGSVKHEDDSRIQCDVYQIALEALTKPGRPSFAALSYAWGQSTAKVQIEVDGHQWESGDPYAKH
jgi:hypothetical protein